jgi:hypothetical protein
MITSPSLREHIVPCEPLEHERYEERIAPRLYSLNRARQKSSIRFKCVECSRQMEARSQDSGVDTKCPHCNAPITVPRIPANPYSRPISTILRQIKAVPFPFPYVPQVVQLSVLLVVLGILGLLFITIGLVSQIGGVLQGLIIDARKHLREGSAVERSAQVLSIAIYATLWLPFWLTQLPFSFIGSLWSSRRIGALVSAAVVLAVFEAIALYSPQLVKLLHLF